MSDQRRNYFLFLEDIMQAIEKIETYTKDHTYFGIDIEAVWDTIQNNIPAFKRHIAEVMLSERS